MRVFYRITAKQACGNKRAATVREGLLPSLPNDHGSSASPATEALIPNPQLHLIRVPPQLRRVHREGARRQRGELPRNLGSQSIADAMLAAREGAGEEADLFVAQLH